MLEIRDLSIKYRAAGGQITTAVSDVNFRVNAGESLGLVGESGAGKSSIALAVIGLHNKSSTSVTGSIRLNETEILECDESTLQAIRGLQVGTIFQDPSTSLNPLIKIGVQICTVLRSHNASMLRQEAREEAVKLLTMVRLADPGLQLQRYPHELSGGMRQRVMVAIALANRPQLLLADEPSTALDVTVQAQLFDIFANYQREHDLAQLLITHDLDLVMERCDRVAVMYAGRIVEIGDVEQVLSSPQHPYTAALLECRPDISKLGERLPELPGNPASFDSDRIGCSFAARCRLSDIRFGCTSEIPTLSSDYDGQSASACHRSSEMPSAYHAALSIVGRSDSSSVDKELSDVERPEDEPHDGGISVRNVSKAYWVGPFGRRRQLWAVSGVSFDIGIGETFAIVGESGCGKSTIGRIVAGLIPPTSGNVSRPTSSSVESRRLGKSRSERQAQIVFQDPFSSLDPKMSIAEIIAEPLRVNTTESRSSRLTLALSLMDSVGLDASLAERLAKNLSGGQQQRVGIARALALGTPLLVLDEAVSALDVSTQAQILNLLRDLQEQRKTSFLLISHDLGVVSQFADRIAVMYLGKIVEQGAARAVIEDPQHPYTQALISAIPRPRSAARRLEATLQGEVPSPLDVASGCAFRSRCWKAKEVCSNDVPTLVPLMREALSVSTTVACFFPGPELSVEAVDG